MKLEIYRNFTMKIESDVGLKNRMDNDIEKLLKLKSFVWCYLLESYLELYQELVQRAINVTI